MSSNSNPQLNPQGPDLNHLETDPSGSGLGSPPGHGGSGAPPTAPVEAGKVSTPPVEQLPAGPSPEDPAASFAWVDNDLHWPNQGKADLWLPPGALSGFGEGDELTTLLKTSDWYLL
jgi:hypothetical protein